jgi:hypothetical protein
MLFMARIRWGDGSDNTWGVCKSKFQVPGSASVLEYRR